MASAGRILERLPSLYRPEPETGADDLLLRLMGAVGTALDDLSRASGEVMQDHWFAYADSALVSGFVGRSRQISEAGPLRLGDPVIRDYPYIYDLARIAGLLDLPPWREPLSDKERVEHFRHRIQRVLRLYRNGLGTLGALRAVTIAALPPVDRAAPAGLRERNFTVEEFSPTRRLLAQAATRGAPQGMVGPLMRWTLNAESREPVLPSLYIQGVTPAADEVDPTEQPAVELFPAALAIAYEGTLAPDEALALLPAYDSWLGGAAGLSRAGSQQTGADPVDPTAAGPWAPEVGGPAGTIAALVQTRDRFLWAAVNAAAAGSLWRFDGSAWAEMLTDLPQVHCLAEDESALIVGFESGLSRLELHPPPPAGLALSPDPATLDGPPVQALLRARDGTWWAATGRGAAVLGPGDSLEFHGPGARDETRTPLFALFEDADGTLFFGGDLGVFQYRRATDRWHWYGGEAADEAVDDWKAFDPASDPLPAAGAVFLPEVRSIRRGADTSLWLGTRRGIARYHAHEQARTFTTLLEARPDLMQEDVLDIVEDERQRLWFATARGLFLYDGLDWFQARGGGLERLPRPEIDPKGVRFWRFDRATDRWQSIQPPDPAGWVNFEAPALGTSEDAVHSIAWTDGVVAQLGSFDGTAFTADEAASPAGLRMRFKPDPTRGVDGGIPAVPRLRPGASEWRYLALEKAVVPTPGSFPAWTREGRLLPPPEDADTPVEGRYLTGEGLDDRNKVFAFCPAARVWFAWRPRELLSVTVRLATLSPEERLDPVILDRVWSELNHVRPAGVRLALAAGEKIVRGN